MIRRNSLTLGLIVALALALRTPAQDPFSDEFKAVPKPKLSLTTRALIKLVDFNASIEPVKVKRGSLVTVTVNGSSKPHAYIYSANKKYETQDGVPSRLEFQNAPWLSPLYPTRESEPETKAAKVDKDTVHSFIHHDRFRFQQELYVAPDAPIGLHRFQLLVKVQVCTKKTKDNDREGCLPADYFTPIDLVLEILEGPPINQPADVVARAKTAPFTLVPPPAGGNPQIAVADPAAINLHDLGGLLLAAFGGAILMLLTPCVFPMIPITVNYFIKQSEKEHHRPFRLASVYALTIVVLLSAVILVVGRYVIDLANDAWFNWGLGIILILFALGLFGMFEVDFTKFFGTVLLVLIAFGLVRGTELIVPRLTDNVSKLWLAILGVGLAVPVTLLLGKGIRKTESLLGFEESSVLRFLSVQESRGGSLGAIFMALTFTITSFSCTGPFLGIMLAPVAGAKPPTLNLVLAAIVYSVTFAAPFFVLALFPTWLKKLPKSGGWMTTIKVTMGFLELGAALKFLANADIFWNPGDARIFNYDTVLCSFIALSLACSLYLFGFFRLDHDTPAEHIGVPRMIFASLFLGFTVYLAPLLVGITPRGLVMENVIAFLPPDLHGNKGRGNGNGSPGHDDLPWITDDYPKAWEQAVKENKLIFIDFTGANCPNCRANERNVLTKPDVVKELKKYVLVQLFTDQPQRPNLSNREREELKWLQVSFQDNLISDVTQPSYVLINPDRHVAVEDERPKGKVLGKRTGLLPGVDDFLQFLRGPLAARQAVEDRAEAMAPAEPAKAARANGE